MTNSNNLVDEYVALGDAIKTTRDRMDQIEHQLVQQMQDDGATKLAHPTQNVSLGTGRATWDHGILAGIREYVEQIALEEVGAFVPAHTETVDVPEKWNITKLKVFKAYGRDIKALIDRARIEGPPRLSIKPKDKKETP